MSLTLNTMPAPGGLYSKALGTVGRKPGAAISIPKAEVAVACVRADGRKLAAYRKICGFENTSELPITYPQVMAGPLHMWMMLRPEFPLPLMGLVHLRNEFEVKAPMAEGASYRVRVSVGGGRQTHLGFEADLVTQFEDEEGKLLYHALMTVLYRMKKKDGSPRKPKPPTPAAALAQYCSFEAPADIGRRYASISGDYNPIHMSGLTAKAFGFPRAIAHGMWSLARSAALLEQANGMAAHRLNVQFRQPLLLPGKVAVKYTNTGGGAEFQLLSRTSDKIHFSGSII